MYHPDIKVCLKCNLILEKERKENKKYKLLKTHCIPRRASSDLHNHGGEIRLKKYKRAQLGSDKAKTQAQVC
jgi:hypothetical protein